MAGRVAQPSEDISELSAGFGASKASMTKDEVGRVLQNIARLLELRREPIQDPCLRQCRPGAGRYWRRSKQTDRRRSPPGDRRHRQGYRREDYDSRANRKTRLLRQPSGRLSARHLCPLRTTGLGAKKIKALHETLGISSITKLERACRRGRIALLPGLVLSQPKTFWPLSKNIDGVSVNSVLAT